VAHDFDNILMGILGFGELAQPLISADSPAASYLAELLRVAQRGLEATRQMHQFSRSGKVTPKATAIQGPWAAGELSRPNELPTGVRVEADLPADLPAVAMASDALRSVIRNLVVNAGEAMPNGGVVSLTARVVRLTEPPNAVLPERLRPGSYVEVVVADTGTGFPPDVLARLAAEPFITTKVRHRGLGLAIVFRILHAHGGGLTIASSPNGSVVRVFLPADENQKTPL
jgi:signal transduction histidine kinase